MMDLVQTRTTMMTGSELEFAIAYSVAYYISSLLALFPMFNVG
jgi:hypothetical protein